MPDICLHLLHVIKAYSTFLVLQRVGLLELRSPPKLLLGNPDHVFGNICHRYGWYHSLGSLLHAARLVQPVEQARTEDGD